MVALFTNDKEEAGVVKPVRFRDLGTRQKVLTIPLAMGMFLGGLLMLALMFAVIAAPFAAVWYFFFRTTAS